MIFLAPRLLLAFTVLLAACGDPGGGESRCSGDTNEGQPACTESDYEYERDFDETEGERSPESESEFENRPPPKNE